VPGTERIQGFTGFCSSSERQTEELEPSIHPLKEGDNCHYISIWTSRCLVHLVQRSQGKGSFQGTRSECVLRAQGNNPVKREKLKLKKFCRR